MLKNLKETLNPAIDIVNSKVLDECDGATGGGTKGKRSMKTSTDKYNPTRRVSYIETPKWLAPNGCNTH